MDLHEVSPFLWGASSAPRWRPLAAVSVSVPLSVSPPIGLTGKAGLQEVGAGWVPSHSCLPSTPYFFMHIHVLRYRRDMKAEFSNSPVIVQISVTP